MIWCSNQLLITKRTQRKSEHHSKQLQYICQCQLSVWLSDGLQSVLGRHSMSGKQDLVHRHTWLYRYYIDRISSILISSTLTSQLMQAVVKKKKEKKKHKQK
jgi:hypothetical protein